MPKKTAIPIDVRAEAPAPVASTSGRTPRMKANDVMRIGRNLSRAPSTAASTMLHPFGSLLAGVFDDQDRVLGSERDQEDEADLGVEIVGGDAALAGGDVRSADVGQRADRPEQRERHAQDHREGQDPALVLARQNEIDEQQREAEHEVDLRADLLLLVGHRGPLEARPGRQDVRWRSAP